MPPESSVAVIIAAKDAASTIARAVRSALAQPPAAEVVVVDDGSRDGTAEAAEGCDDRSGRLKVLRLPRNLGPSAARNHALARSTAPLLCVLDADDYFEPGRLEAMLAEAPAQWDFLADDLILTREGELGAGLRRLLDEEPPAPRAIDAAAFVRANLSSAERHRRELGFLKPLVRRAFLERHGLAYDETLRLGEDYAFYAQALLLGARFVLIRACGYVAVEQPASLSNSHKADDLEALVAADRRLLALAKDQPEAARAIREHLRALQLDFDFRRVLAANREKRFDLVFAHLFRTPRTTGHILGHTFRAWAARALR